MVATLESVSATTPDFFSSMTPNLLSVAFLAVLFYASFIDIRERIIPNRVVVAGIALWCVSLLAQVVGVIEGWLFVYEPSSAVGLVFNGATSSSAMNASPGSPCELADACSSNLDIVYGYIERHRGFRGIGLRAWVFACGLVLPWRRAAWRR